jgi:Glyoxalase/Bleomycin resistance protein/Dioxygenase superfamily
MELRVVRLTDRFDAGCHFYGSLLGWPVTRSWVEGGRGCIFGHGSTGIELIEVATTEAVTGVFLSIECAAVQPLHDALVSAGVPISQPLAVQPWGHRNFGVVDPTGITLVFFEWV